MVQDVIMGALISLYTQERIQIQSVHVYVRCHGFIETIPKREPQLYKVYVQSRAAEFGHGFAETTPRRILKMEPQLYKVYIQ